MTAIKRVNRRRPSYFNGQLLDEKDFRAEQEYHQEAWRRHHATFHSWGVIGGLTVSVDNRRAVIAPGVAVDSLGREVRLEEPAVLELTGSRGETIHILLAYEEEAEDTRSSEHGEAGASRIVEYSVASASTTAGAGGAVTVAEVTLKEQGADVSYANTQYASSRIGPGRIGYEELHAGVRQGWVRLPFKPLTMEDAKPFRIGPTEARSSDQGASGSMGIPVPPGATRAIRFRIAGEVNEGAIKVEFFRCGWDVRDDEPLVHHGAVDADERLSMLAFEYDPKSATKSGEYLPSSKKTGAYRFTGVLDRDLDPEYHGLAVVITVSKKASISLVAVEFGFPGNRT